MVKNSLALVGGLLILGSAFLGIAWAHYWEATNGSTAAPDLEELGIWRLVQSSLGIIPDQAFVLSLVGLLLGVSLTIPWWRERLGQERLWWEKRDDKLDTPPPAGM